jgi:hypothetical protein
LDYQKKFVDTITITIFYLKFKENNENDMAAQVFWAVFCFRELVVLKISVFLSWPF